MGLAQQEHAQAALADTAADGAGEFPGEQAPVEGEFRLRAFALDFELAAKRFLVHADAHAGQLERTLQDVVPHEDIAVQALETLFVGAAPVVVVGGAAVVRRSVGEHPANADDEHGAPAAHDLVLTLFGIQAGVELHQLLGVDEMDFLREFRDDLGELHEKLVLGDLDGLVDAANGLLEETQVAVFAADDLLPVPLIHVDGVEVVQFFVGPQGVHVGVDAAPGTDAHLRQLDALPFGQGVHDFRLALVHVADGEADGPLHAVQLVVEAGPGEHDHRGGHAQQGQLG